MIGPEGKVIEQFHQLQNQNAAANLFFEQNNSNLNKDNWFEILTKKAQAGDPASLDLFMQYMMNETSLQSAREYETKMNSQRYQTMVEDLKKAGINPYWIQSLGSAPNYTGSSGSYSGNAYSNSSAREETARNNFTNQIIKFLGVLAGLMSSSAMAAAIAGS